MNSKRSLFVINLARRPERWQRWVKTAEKWGVKDYQRFEAVDGKVLQFTDELKYLFRNNDFENNPFAMACALSHVLLWIRVIEDQLTSMIIFEDDAQFTRPFEIPDLPQGWDLFYFGGANLPNIYPPGDYYKDNIMVPKLNPPQFFSNVCYMLSFDGAKKLVMHIHKNGIPKHIDRVLMDLHENLNVFCYTPLPVFADRSYGSDTLNLESSL